ncbi:MAG: glycogen synthase GlgA, partial [Chromatiaceae bacterium]
MRLLFATSELYPFIKTGGLGDVAFSLPVALTRLGIDVRVVLPAFRPVLQEIQSFGVLGWLTLANGSEVRVLQAEHPTFPFPVWLLDVPGYYDRAGLPYTDEKGLVWPDNPARFAVFSEAAALLAMDALNLGWRADVAHANDWQTGLMSAYLAQEPQRPRTVFTIHNLAYDTQVDFGTFQHLQLPEHWWSVEIGEFYDRFSLLKSGLTTSDVITTVSPRYAREIRTAELGYGYASILETRAEHLFGILNGIDDSVWDPATDRHLVAHYDVEGGIRRGKALNQKALLEALGASPEAIANEGPLIGSVGRLVYQKGIDLLLEVIPDIVESTDARFVVIGTGEPRLERQLGALCDRYPDRVFSFIGYSEPLAHLLEAGCSLFAMPSRYEPCGLNQMYSLRYGTPPVVRATGGLADTVVDADPRGIAREEANGFTFEAATAAALQDALQRAIALFAKPKSWIKLVKNGMREDHSWQRSAEHYLQIY